MAATDIYGGDSSDEEVDKTTKQELMSYYGEVEVYMNYTTELAFHLNELRNQETLCDVTIIVNHRRFRAHKVVLCAASSYFSAMFTSGFQETSQAEINIEGNSEAFERLLDFAYTGTLKLSPELISEIISMASYMQFNKAAPLCSRYLKAAYKKKAIRLPDAFNILNLAITHEFPSLQRHAQNYLAANLVEFSSTSSFLKEASAEYVESLLKRKDLVLWAKEEQVGKGISGSTVCTTLSWQ